MCIGSSVCTSTQAVKCCLADLPVSVGCWTPDAVQWLKETALRCNDCSLKASSLFKLYFITSFYMGNCFKIISLISFGNYVCQIYIYIYISTMHLLVILFVISVLVN